MKVAVTNCTYSRRRFNRVADRWSYHVHIGITHREQIETKRHTQEHIQRRMQINDQSAHDCDLAYDRIIG